MRQFSAPGLVAGDPHPDGCAFDEHSGLIVGLERLAPHRRSEVTIADRPTLSQMFALSCLSVSVGKCRSDCLPL
jgi:hypothetical protein